MVEPVSRDAEFSNDEKVEGFVKSGGDLRSDGDSAAGEGEDDEVSGVLEFYQSRGQPAACIPAVGEGAVDGGGVHGIPFLSIRC
jgi:hypothetical protein